MLLDSDKKEMQDQSVREAIRFYKNVSQLSQKLNTHHSSITKVINEGRRFSLKHALEIEKEKKIHFERLTVFTEEENRLIKNREKWLRNPFVEIELKKIRLNGVMPMRSIPSSRPIIMATDHTLISGLWQVEQHRANHYEKASVIVVDLEALWSKMKSYADFYFDFLIEEKVWMGLWIETWRGHLYPPVDQVIGGKSIRIAEILEFGCKSIYHDAKQICLLGAPELIQLMNHQLITMTEAVSIAKGTQAEQRAWIQSNLEGVTR